MSTGCVEVKGVRAYLCLTLTEEKFPSRPDELRIRNELELNSRTVSCSKDPLVVVDPDYSYSLTYRLKMKDQHQQCNMPHEHLTPQ
jgi:hypothetical protein